MKRVSISQRYETFTSLKNAAAAAFFYTLSGAYASSSRNLVGRAKMTIWTMTRSKAIRLNGTLPAFRSRADRNADTTLNAINHHGLTPASLNRRQPTVNAGKANIDHA